ncbi:MAG TPA: gamma-glutamylcyclotransferase family protein [Sphingobium sp.]
MEDASALPIFVYGTLRPGDVGFTEAGLEGRVEIVGPACVHGTLYDLGEYPGIVLDGIGLVHGELLLPRDNGVLPLLDDYELYNPSDPASSEYVRVCVKTVDSGVSTWIYIYNFPLSNVPTIGGGDWMRRSR